MSDQKDLKKRLKALMSLPENQVCSDCTERQPRWASLIVPPPGAPEGSLPIGAFCCLECSGSHRRLGVHISFVRSINLDSWKEREVLSMENGGNAKVNAIFEANLNRDKPTNHADLQTRERYIRDKYERRKFYDPSAFGSYRAAAPAAPPRSAAQQPQEISLPALRPGPVGPPSDVAQRRIQERRRRNQSSGSSAPSADKNLRRVNSSEGVKKKTSRKIKAQGSNVSSVSQSSSIDLLDFSDPPPAPSPVPEKSADLFGDFSTPSETFGNSFFGGDKPGHKDEKKSNAAADIMALYGAGGGGGNQQSHGNNGFFGGGGMSQGHNGMNAMMNQMGQMDLSGRGVQQPMMTPQQQQQHMMMQQQQQQMMMMMQGQGVPQSNMGGFNPQMMNGNMMMGQTPSSNGFGGQMASMGNGGGRPQQKEDPFASLGGRNTFR